MFNDQNRQNEKVVVSIKFCSIFYSHIKHIGIPIGFRPQKFAAYLQLTYKQIRS